jgi:hypothetical protein
VIKDGYAFFTSMPSLVECKELTTGKKIWEQKLRENGAKADSWSSLMLSGDSIYLVNQNGETAIFRARPEFQFIQLNSIGNEHTNASTAASNGEIFIRTDQNLWCIGEATKTAGNY